MHHRKRIQPDTGLSSLTRRTSRAARPAAIDEYSRERDLPHLVPLLAAELATPKPEHQRTLLALIRRALRAERRRARAGDWSYDLGRHAALLAAYRHERDLLENAQLAPSRRG